MPPESSAGSLTPASAGRPARASFIAVSLSCSSGGRSVCSRIGSMTFWATESEENRAPCWNRTPKSDAFSAGPSASTGLSPTRTSPLSGRCRPASVLSRTDLPDPEPPAMPRTSPRRTSRLIPSCTFCVPNRFTTSRAETIGLRCRCVAGFIGPTSRTGWRTAHPARSRQRSS